MITKMRINYAIVMYKPLLNRCFLMTHSLSKVFVLNLAIPEKLDLGLKIES